MSINKKNIFHLKWDIVVLAILIVIYVAVFTSLSILRHNAFASNFDLSNMDQTLWFTLNGHFFSLRLPDEIISRLAVHADFVLVLLSPIYLIKDDVRMLLFVQSLALGLGGIPTYILSLKILRDKVISLAIVFAYLLNPGLQWTNIYDFHAVSLAVPLLISAFYFAYIKNWKWYFLTAFLALLTKEQISLIISVLGLIILFVFKNKKIGISTFLIGIVWFVAMVYVVMPYFSPLGQHWVLAARDESSIFDTLRTLNNPQFIAERFFVGRETLNYYKLILQPFGYMPLVGFPWLILSLPHLFIVLLMDTRSINFHYDSASLPGIIIATIFGFKYLNSITEKFVKQKSQRKTLIYISLLIFILISIRSNYFYSPLPTTPSCWCYIYRVTDEDKQFERIIQILPKNEIITSSLEIRPHLSHRPYSFAVPSATESAKYIALIKQNRIIGNYEPKEYENKLIPILLGSNNHVVIFESKNFYLFERINHK